MGYTGVKKGRNRDNGKEQGNYYIKRARDSRDIGFGRKGLLDLLIPRIRGCRI